MAAFSGNSVTSTNYPNWHNYNLSFIPNTTYVRKKTIVRACVDCSNFSHIDSRSFGIGSSPLNNSWEIEFVFDNTTLWWDVDSGHYARGPGIKVDVTSDSLYSYFGIDTIKIANYEAAANSSFFNDFNTSNISNHLKNPVKGSLLIYKDNLFFAEVKGGLRVNGNSTIHYPLKGLKFFSNERVESVPFLKTKNVYFRKVLSPKNGMANAVINETSNLPHKRYQLDKITKNQAYVFFSIYNGKYLESFGLYNAIESNDKKFTKEYLNFKEPEIVHIVPPQFGSFASLFGDSSNFRNTINLFEDTVSLNTMNFDTITKYVNVNLMLHILVSKSIYRVTDAWTNNFIVVCENGKNCTPIFKDDDGGMPIVLNGNSPFNYNFLGFYLTGDTAFGPGYFDIDYSEEVNNWPSYFARSALYYSNDSIKHYYRNVLLDFVEIYKPDKINSIIDSHINSIFSDYSFTNQIDNINSTVDSTSLHNLLQNQKTYALSMYNQFLLDWMDVFHRGYDLSDIFDINIDMDNVAKDTTCNLPAGEVIVNSLHFDSSGVRTHIRDYPIEIKANPLPGWVFNSWVEFPDSGSIITLNHNSTNDIILTPIFTKQKDFCYNQSELVINEVLPWSSNGSDKVELFNSTDDPIYIGGCFITDSNNKIKHQFENSDSMFVPAKGYFSISFGSNNSEYHNVNEFGLDKNGELVTIYNRDTVVIDNFIWEESTEDLSFQKCNQNWILNTPSIGFDNNCNLDNLEILVIEETTGCLTVNWKTMNNQNLSLYRSTDSVNMELVNFGNDTVYLDCN